MISAIVATCAKTIQHKISCRQLPCIVDFLCPSKYVLLVLWRDVLSREVPWRLHCQSRPEKRNKVTWKGSTENGTLWLSLPIYCKLPDWFSQTLPGTSRATWWNARLLIRCLTTQTISLGWDGGAPGQALTRQSPRSPTSFKYITSNLRAVEKDSIQYQKCPKQLNVSKLCNRQSSGKSNAQPNCQINVK